VIASGFDHEKLFINRCGVIYLLSSVVFFCGIGTIGSAVLNSQENFALASLVPVLTPLVINQFSPGDR